MGGMYTFTAVTLFLVMYSAATGDWEDAMKATLILLGLWAGFNEGARLSARPTHQEGKE